MKQRRQLYPIGIQTFSELRKGGYVYIDKTDLIYQLTHTSGKYFFLSRPRRFGKSLLTSTFQSYFEGRKELFKGLAIENMEREWTAYPVLKLDMSLGKHLDREALGRYLLSQLEPYENEYGLKPEIPDANIRLANLIRSAYEQTGQQAVVLIDEYDAPLLDVVHKEGELEALRHIMRNFYSPLKACDPYLRFVFLTGITKFSQLSIFSELNNINNISMDPPYATLCGITEDEMKTRMEPGIQRLADKAGISYDEALDGLKANYDGYHFTWPSPDIYNPYSLLNALAKASIDSYWFGSGTPTYLIEMLKKFNVVPSEIGGRKVLSSAFDSSTERLSSITPLLYQSGYITITGFIPPRMYCLDIPNEEVRIGLMESLLPSYLSGPKAEESQYVLFEMSQYFEQGDAGSALQKLRDFLNTVPYTDNTHYEGHWQQMLYVIFSLLGLYVDIEVRTPQGRVDMVLRTQQRLYLIELKLNKDAATALQQINLKDYASRFALCGLPVTKVGINFDSEKHTLSDWKIE